MACRERDVLRQKQDLVDWARRLAPAEKKYQSGLNAEKAAKQGEINDKARERSLSLVRARAGDV